MKITVRRWGNSLAIRIPKVFAVQLGIESGREVNIDATDDAIRISKPDETLSDLLSRVTQDNLHGETDAGDALGSEVW